jgi:hypothetical protein
MPYNNEYNRRLARQVSNADRNYADRNAYSKSDGLTGGIRFNSGNASKRVDSEGYYELPHLPDVYYEGEGLMEGGHHPDDENEDYCIKGGSGFASGSYRDTGFGSVKGAGGSGGGASGGTKMHLMPVIKDDVIPIVMFLADIIKSIAPEVGVLVNVGVKVGVNVGVLVNVGVKVGVKVPDF